MSEHSERPKQPLSRYTFAAAMVFAGSFGVVRCAEVISGDVDKKIQTEKTGLIEQAQKDGLTINPDQAYQGRWYGGLVLQNCELPVRAELSFRGDEVADAYNYTITNGAGIEIGPYTFEDSQQLMAGTNGVDPCLFFDPMM